MKNHNQIWLGNSCHIFHMGIYILEDKIKYNEIKINYKKLESHLIENNGN